MGTYCKTYSVSVCFLALSFNVWEHLRDFEVGKTIIIACWTRLFVKQPWLHQVNKSNSHDSLFFFSSHQVQFKPCVHVFKVQDALQFIILIKIFTFILHIPLPLHLAESGRMLLSPTQTSVWCGYTINPFKIFISVLMVVTGSLNTLAVK